MGGVIGSVPTPRIRIGGPVQAAKLVSKVDPVYPAQARAAGIEGEVVLNITISEDGHVEAAEPTDGNAMLATAAVEAVKQWVYRPTLLNGQPVTVMTQVTVPFKLQ
jgi:protein TonB